MTEKKIYYFTFDLNCWNPRNSVGMHSYWVELHGADTKAEARDTMIRLYACGFRTHEEKDLEWIMETCNGGCYEQIHLPLPDDIHIESSDPFFNKPKKKKKSTGEKKRQMNYAAGGILVDKSLKPLTKMEQVMMTKGINIRTIHQATGISYPVLKDLKSGRKQLYHKKTIEKLTDYLGVYPKDIL